MAKKRIFLTSLSALLSIFMLFACMISQTAFADDVIYKKNENYSIVASSDKSGEGVILVSFSGQDDVSLEFDLLKEVDSGYFGIISYNSEYFDISAENGWNGDYVMTSPNGGLLFNKNMTAPDFQFNSGFRYKIEFNRSKSNVTIYNKAYGQTENSSYKMIYKSSSSVQEADTFGIMLHSIRDKSAWAIIDNVKATLSNGFVIEDDFEGNSRVMNVIKGNESCFAEIYKGPKYHVVFLDVGGNEIAIADVTQYSNIEYFLTSSKEKTFIGWSANINNIQSDLTVFPLYKTNETSEDESQSQASTDEDESQSQTSTDEDDSQSQTATDKDESQSQTSTGCFGSINFGSNVFLCLLIGISLLIIWRKKDADL